MAIELAQAYVSLTAETSRIPKQVGSALDGAQGQADKAGAGIGSRLASGIGTTLKAGAIGAGVVAGGAIATALTKGMGRLDAMEQAEAKLSGLGNSAATVSTVMADALAAVKGTAFGLGDAAAIAASAVAAGVKPGEDLQRTLKLTGDAATIAGSSLGEMGAIFGKVAASNKIQGDVIAQLNDRGIPIIQLLSEELGTSAEETLKLASAGKVGFDTFQNAMEAGLGGAALKAGNTFRGSIDNANAALGRLGAAALKPTFERMAGGVGSVTTGIDSLTPRVTDLAEALDAKVFEDWGPKLASSWAAFRSSDAASDAVSRLTTLMASLQTTTATVAPAIGEIATSLARAGASAGGAGLSLFLDALNGAAPVVAGVLVPAIDTLSSVMQANQGVVTGLLTAYAGFKLVSFLSATKGMQSLSAASTGALGSLRNVTAGVRDTRRMFDQTGNSVSRFGATMAYLSTGEGSVSRLAASFRDGQSSVSRFGGAMGTAAAAGTGLKMAAGGLMSAMGGPLGLAVAGATAAFVLHGKEQAKTAERNRALEASAKDLADELVTSGGAATDVGTKAAAAALEADKLAGSGQSLIQYLEGIGVSGEQAARGLAGSKAAMAATLDVMRERAELEKETNAAMIDNSLNPVVGLKNVFNYDGFRDKANEAQNALADYEKLAESARQQAESIRRVNIAAGNLNGAGTATALGTMRDTMREFGESTGGAASKIDILNGGLATLRGDQLSVQDAQQRVNDSMRGFTAALGEGGAAAISASGQIDTTTEAGSRLYSAMKSVQSGFDAAGAAAKQQATDAGRSQEEIAAAVQSAGQRVRDEFVQQQIAAGRTVQEANAVADAYGLIPSDLKTVLTLDAEQAKREAILAGRVLDEVALKDRVATIRTRFENGEISRSQQWAETISASSNVRRAAGGAVHGAGGPTSDSIPALLSDNEHVITADEVKAAGGHGAIMEWRRDIRNGALRRAEGGPVTRGGIDAALSAARSVEGNAYLWGGTGPSRFDCSGFVGWLQQIVQGVTGSVKRLYTTYSLIGGAMAGLQPGLGPAGTLFQVGVSDEHMAATVAGHAAESGGAHGTSGLDGGRASAQSSQFPHKFHLPNGAIAGFVEGQAGQEQDTDTVGAASADTSNVPAPQAPALARAWDDVEIARAEAEADRNDANRRRNEVYADATSTQSDRDRADIALVRAQRKLDEVMTQKPEAVTADDAARAGDFSLKGRLKQFGTEVAGALVDGAFAQIPFGLGESRWLTADWAGLAGQGTRQTAPTRTFDQDEVDAQLGFTPDGGGAPDWAKGGPLEELMKRLQQQAPKPKVFDTGGWLLPGESAINLSDKPEPIFNSPEQLAKFTSTHGLEAQPPQPVTQDYSITVHDPVVDNFREFKGRLNTLQRERSMGFMRR